MHVCLVYAGKRTGFCHTKVQSKNLTEVWYDPAGNLHVQ